MESPMIRRHRTAILEAVTEDGFSGAAENPSKH